MVSEWCLEDEQLKIALKELLDASGIDLDARLNEQVSIQEQR